MRATRPRSEWSAAIPSPCAAPRTGARAPVRDEDHGRDRDQSEPERHHEQRRKVLQRERGGREVHATADGHQEGQQAVAGRPPISLWECTRSPSDFPADGSSFCQTIDMLCSRIVTEALVDWELDAGAGPGLMAVSAFR